MSTEQKLTAAQVMGRKRWHGVSKTKRRAHAKKMVEARQAKAKVNGKAKAHG